MLALAHEYRRIAISANGAAASRHPISEAPYRFAAVHALELYLSSFLLHTGTLSKELRGVQHDLSWRRDRARAHGLVLRKKTNARIDEIALKREYVSSRYAIKSELEGIDLPQLLKALQEVAAKVTGKICNGK